MDSIVLESITDLNTRFDQMTKNIKIYYIFIKNSIEINHNHFYNVNSNYFIFYIGNLSRVKFKSPKIKEMKQFQITKSNIK